MSDSDMGRGARLLSAILGIALFQGGAAPLKAQGLPGGASTLNEIHGDWSLACAVSEAAPRCAISQTLVSEQNRQRVLGIELQATGSAVSGALLLPFGLDLSRGARLSIDAADPLPPLSIATCLPAGCIAPVALPAGAVSAMRAGSVLDVEVVAADTGQAVVFSLSLSGFTAALNRIVALDGS